MKGSRHKHRRARERTATFLHERKRLNGVGNLCTQRHYRLSHKLGGHRYVIVSAVTLDIEDFYNSNETFIFGATKRGRRIKDGNELVGSQRGTLDHAQALRDAGYRVVGGLSPASDKEN